MKKAFFCLYFFATYLHSFSQQIEKIEFDKNDKNAGYYLAVRPVFGRVECVLVILSSFLPPEGVLPETKLHNVASVNGILTIVVSSKQKLFADTITVNRINSVLNDIVTRFNADKNKFALAGYDEAGLIVLRYTELTYENPSAFAIQPKAVFTIDAPTDLFEFWRWSENQIRKNFYQGSVGDAKYYLDEMKKSIGTIADNTDAYTKLTPFKSQDEFAGNERFLKDIPVRVYYDTDINWQLKNRRNSFNDTKIPAASELIKRLLLSGNKHAEFMSAKQPGIRSNGARNPNSFSIVDEVECIQWLKNSLQIFDPNNWNPVYTLLTPPGWTTEHFALPPDFAPTMTFKGVEDIRFPKGWGDSTSTDYWSYAYLWWLSGKPVLDATSLQENLKAYYTGLVGINIESRKIPATKQIPTTVNIRKVKQAAGDIETFSGNIRMLNYMTQKPILLNVMVHIKNCAVKGKTAVFLKLSPQSPTHAIWQQFETVNRQIQCAIE